MRFPHPFEGVRPPTDYWVDRPEVYSSNAQPTGTNRPNTCHTNPQHNQQTLDVGTTRGHHDGKTQTPCTTTNTRPHNPTPPNHTGGVHKVTAATATGKHPDPSRTRKLSLPAPMVLQPRGCGRVGRRRTNIANGRPVIWSPVVLFQCVGPLSVPRPGRSPASPQAVRCGPVVCRQHSVCWVGEGGAG